MSRRYAFFAKLALLAFVVRSFIPVGFMPGGAAEGFAPLVICSGFGTTTVYVPQDKAPDQKPHVSHEAGVCAFSAALAWGAVPAGTPVFTAAAVAGNYSDHSKVYFGSLEAKPYYSQGPPFLA